MRSKEKGKSKKKGNKSSNDWEFDGGVVVEEKHDVDAPLRKRRITQEMVDRDRRRKRRFREIQQQQKVKSKLAKGYRAYVAEALKNEEPVPADDPQPPLKRPKPNFSRSTRSVFDRLMSKVTKSGKWKSDVEEDDLEYEDSTAVTSVAGLNVDDHSAISVEAPDRDDAGVKTDPSEHLESASLTIDYFEMFFPPAETENDSKRNDEVTPKPSATTISVSRGRFEVHSTRYSARVPIRTLSDIAGVNKLWKQSLGEPIRGLEAALLGYMCTYSDLLFDGRTHLNDQDILHACLLHAAIHIVRIRTIILKHNKKIRDWTAQKKLRQQSERLLEEDNDDDGDIQDEELGQDEAPEINEHDKDTLVSQDLEIPRDQGFTRPRVLILCPVRATAKRTLDTFVEILGPSTSVTGLERFNEEFGCSTDQTDEEEEKAEGRELGVTASVRVVKSDKRKAGLVRPVDWQQIFGENSDDDFRLGMQVTPLAGKGKGAQKGVELKLFTEFFKSDIVLASPLGLKLSAEKKKETNFDFLSSVELVILHQADVMLMQNPEHLRDVLSTLNNTPEQDHNTDFSRVREYFLNGGAAAHRQLILTSWFSHPLLNSMFRANARSCMGQVQLKTLWTTGSITRVISPVRQIFHAVACKSALEQDDARFEYFCSTILPQVLSSQQKHTLIFTASYLEYVRIRNELIKRKASAVFVCEYSRSSETSRGRSRFFNASRDLLLYSGRAHFFFRYRLRGARHLIFYSLPEYPHFYSEMVNTIGDSSSSSDTNVLSCSCMSLFTRYDKLALERIVGLDRCAHMLTSDSTTFLLC